MCNPIPCNAIDSNVYLRGLPNPMNCSIAPTCCMQVHGPVPVAIPGLDDAKCLQRKCLCCNNNNQECPLPDLHRKDLKPTIGGPNDLKIETNLVEYWSWYPEFWKFHGLCNADINWYPKPQCPSTCGELIPCDICNPRNKCSSFAIKLDPGKCFLRTPLVDQNYYAPKVYQPHPRKFVNCINPVFGL